MEEELHKQLTELQSELTRLKKTIEYLESAEEVIEASEKVTKTLEEILPSFEKLKEAVELLLKKIEEIDFDRELKEIKSRLSSILSMCEDIQRDLSNLKKLVIDEFGEIKNSLHNISISIETTKKSILDQIEKQEKLVKTLNGEFKSFLADYYSDMKFLKNSVVIFSVIIIFFLIVIFSKL